MSIVTCFIFITTLILLDSTQGHCDSLKSEKQARENAYIEHFQAVKKVKSMTPAAAHSLRTNILLPADQNLQNSQKNDYLSKNPISKPVRVTDRSHDTAFREKRDKEDQEDIKEHPGAKDKSESNASDSIVSRPRPPEVYSRPSREEVVLDGSDIPKELEFTGKAKTPSLQPKKELILPKSDR